MKWLDNYQKVKQLRDALVWLPVWERDKRAFVPEVRLLTVSDFILMVQIWGTRTSHQRQEQDDTNFKKAALSEVILIVSM